MKKQKEIIIVSFGFVILLLAIFSILTIVSYNEDYSKESYLQMFNVYNQQFDCSKLSYCLKLTSNPKLISFDAISQFFYLKSDYYLNYLPILMPILIIVLSSIIFKLKFKNKMLTNYIIRKNYKNYFMKSYRTTLLAILIIPIFYILFLIFNILDAGHFDTTYRINYEANISGISINKLKDWFYVLLFLIMNVSIHYLFLINLVVIQFRKISNIILGIITTFMTYMIIWVLTEGFLQLSIFNNFKYKYLLSFGSIWNINEEAMIYNITFNIILFLTSLAIVKIIYKNKESVIVNNE